MDGNIMNEGFYALFNERDVVYAPNFVFAPNFALIKEDIEEYKALDIFPMDGWYWFDSDDEAYAFFGVEKPTTPKNDRDGII